MKPAHLSRLLIFAAFVALAATAAWLGYQTASAATVGVDGGNNWFCDESFEGTPCETNVTAGDTVVWTMVSGTHTVTECNADFTACPPTGGWTSEILLQGDTYSQTFANPGTYPYRCELHPSDMLGKIIVAAVVTASPTPVVTAQATAAPTGASSTSTVTPAAIPQTGGPTSGSPDLALLSVAVVLLAVAAVAFAYARKQRI